MKRKLLIAILALIIVSQIPFAYRRYRLRRLRETIQQLAHSEFLPQAKASLSITRASFMFILPWAGTARGTLPS